MYSTNFEYCCLKPQNNDGYNTRTDNIADTCINAVATVSADQDWKKAADAMLRTVKKLKLMSRDKGVCEYMLEKELGFVRQPESYYRGMTAGLLSHSMNPIFTSQAEVILFLRCHSHSTKTGYVALVPNGEKWVLKADWDPSYWVVRDMYVRWKDGKKHGTGRKRTTEITMKKCPEQKIPANHQYYVYSQPNPMHLTGDCVVRAVSNAFAYTWDEAYEKIVRAADYRTVAVDCDYEYRSLLKRVGFRRRKLDKPMTAAELCEKLNQDQYFEKRIIAEMWRHVAAILPESKDGKRVYRVHDCFDSSNMYVSSYWEWYADGNCHLPGRSYRYNELLNHSICHMLYGPGIIERINWKNDTETALVRFPYQPAVQQYKYIRLDFLLRNCLIPSKQAQKSSGRA